MADRDYAFAHAQETIQSLEKEVEELQDGVQQEIDNAGLQRLMQVAQAKSADRASETYRMDRDESPEQSRAKAFANTANEAASSSNEPKVFFPLLPTKDARGDKPFAEPATDNKNSQGNPTDWGNWDPKDNPAVSHGLSSRAAYEEAVRLNRLAARKEAVAEQILPLVASNVGQDGGGTPTLSAIPPPTTFGFGKKVNDKISIGGWPSIKLFSGVEIVVPKICSISLF